MDKDQLRSLRTQILNDITPLASEVDVTPDSFDVLLRIIQSGGATSDIYTKAYASAKLIQDKEQRLQALVSLLDEVTFMENQSGLVEESEFTRPLGDANVEPSASDPVSNS